MKIETKYCVEQNVWFMRNNKAVQGIISQIEIRICVITSISYVLNLSHNPTTPEYIILAEDDVFATKQELLDSL